MSSPEPGGRSRPLRVAGLALLGIAVGALLVGLISIGGGNGGGGDGGNAAPTTGGGPATSGGSSSTGSDSSGSNSSGSNSSGPGSNVTTAPVTSEPTTTNPAPPAPTRTVPTIPPAIPTVPVRVYNNSTIRGLAAQAADDFRRAGWTVVEVANYPNARIPTSTVYFRPGTDEEPAAQRLGDRFNLRVEPRFEGIANASPGLIVIVTNDYGSK
jgi:LytR cell envelope-related transcriptional attenuator